MGVGGGGPGLMGAMGPRMIFSGQAFSETELMTDLPKKKFTGRCRLFVGNLPMDLKEEELKELFAPHGDIAECYLSGKGFAFLRMVSFVYCLYINYKPTVILSVFFTNTVAKKISILRQI